MIKWGLGGVGLIVATVWLAWVTSPDPTGNPASFEQAPLASGIVALGDGYTLASLAAEDGTRATMLVSEYDGTTVSGVDLVAFGAERTGDLMLDFASMDRAALTPETVADAPRIAVPIGQILPSAPAGTRHIGTGTNFPEHAEEANSGSVFRFPKFGPATPARTRVTARENILLDYEVELCMRFDRDITKVEDFEAATKGVFLCGDFTNRNALVQLADPDNLDSGYGFSDAKSGPDAFPSGPFVVVPRDWRAFVAEVRMTTSVNGEPRQDARGAEMTLDFEGLAEQSLNDMSEQRFYYQGEFFRLAPDGMIARDMTLMSGTSEGVIFTGPARADFIEGIVDYLADGGPLSDQGLVQAVKDRFIANELASGHFLQPGDVVVHDSNWLGDIEVMVE